ncbi:hypothetical protein PR202_gb12381 [Eleusine coracana subsp. coracana]|uniref:Disease resistance R13L4/SHOC-2-like LRR domain-containing protein n=1 Tax=Eleusine coracana subsp. coracana TaxID=191504 RepID=A0AAV5EMN4_ELECO|nr:hypothetical protein PR202_gb12381 [Eleusine coracana subsp. coracana]
MTLMEAVDSYLDELVSRNMVEPVHVSYDGKVESFQVHDMLLEVMVSKSLDLNFVSLLGGQYAGKWLYLLKFLSLKGTNLSEVPHQIEQLEHLQVLDVSGTHLKGLSETVTNLERLEHLQFSKRNDWGHDVEVAPRDQKDEGIARDLYDNSMTLDFLCSIPKPPWHLRYLRIADGIKELLDWIGSLTYLVEFDMSRGEFVGD